MKKVEIGENLMFLILALGAMAMLIIASMLEGGNS